MGFKKKSLYKQIPAFIAGSALLGISLPTWSNGFFLPEQNVTNLGTAYAGTASLARDASTNYYNAGGLTELCGDQAVFGGVLVQPHTTLYMRQGTDSFGGPLRPGHTQPHNFAMIPSMHYASKMNDQMAWGISMVSNFGSKTNYRQDSLARYTATRSELITVDLAPSAAYRVNDCLSLGAGIDVLYVSARLDSKIGVGHYNTDGYFTNKGSRTTLGYHLGALYKADDCTRFGLAYRSIFTPKLRGHSLTKNPNISLPGIGPLPQNVVWHHLHATLPLPDTITLSGYHDLNECWAVVADGSFFRWKRYKTLVIRYDDGSRLVSPQQWKNTYRFALGGIYQFNAAWQFKLGSSFDKTSTKTATRNIYIPDQDQTALAVGTRYQLNKCMAIDMGYVHVFYRKAHINQYAATASGPMFPQQPAQSIRGCVKNKIDAVGMQLTWDIT